MPPSMLTPRSSRVIRPRGSGGSGRRAGSGSGLPRPEEMIPFGDDDGVLEEF